MTLRNLWFKFDSFILDHRQWYRTYNIFGSNLTFSLRRPKLSFTIALLELHRFHFSPQSHTVAQQPVTQPPDQPIIAALQQRITINTILLHFPIGEESIGSKIVPIGCLLVLLQQNEQIEKLTLWGIQVGQAALLGEFCYASLDGQVGLGFSPFYDFLAQFLEGLGYFLDFLLAVLLAILIVVINFVEMLPVIQPILIFFDQLIQRIFLLPSLQETSKLISSHINPPAINKPGLNPTTQLPSSLQQTPPQP